MMTMDMYIERKTYLQAVEKYIDLPLVKILTGVRRSGKSTVLTMVADLLESRGIHRERILFYKLDSIEYAGRLDASLFYREIKEKAEAQEGKLYLFLDEIQELPEWEKFVNSLVQELGADVYVTGSNSRLLSGEISTHLSGRYVTIPLYTLSFAEYLLFRGIEESTADLGSCFASYLKEGGFPGLILSPLRGEELYPPVKDIYQSIVLSDIVNRKGIRNFDLFERVVRFLFENLGKTFSANSVSKFLKSEGRKVAVETIYDFIGYLEKSYIVYRCPRYDVKGKKVLKTMEKYFLADPSLKYALFGYSPSGVSAMLENIVYLEMKRRGYEVYVGKVGDKEIDFVGERAGKKIYIQAAKERPDSERESLSLRQTGDEYPKYIVTTDPLYVGNEKGIEVVYLPRFLLDKNW